MKNFELALNYISKHKCNCIDVSAHKNHFRLRVQLTDKNCNIVFYHKIEIYHELINKLDFLRDNIKLSDKLSFIDCLRNNLQSNIYKVKFKNTGL